MIAIILIISSTKGSFFVKTVCEKQRISDKARGILIRGCHET
jgi:hypothetical protein